MKSIYNLLKEEVRKSHTVQNSILGNSHPWKRSHYIILSEIIKEDLSNREELQNERKFELGTSISHITLQRFFESDYHYKTHNDLRFLKTLDKICIFLGFKDLNSYVMNVKENNVYNEAFFSKEFTTDIVNRYCHTNLSSSNIFPRCNWKYLMDSYFRKRRLLNASKITVPNFVKMD